MFNALETKDFFSIFYFKKIVGEEEFADFTNALTAYKAHLQSSANQNEDSIVANALKPFFQALGFSADIKHKQKGNSEIDLVLKKDSAVTTIIEAKKPNSTEMFSPSNPHAKALCEAILYYFRERESGNLGIQSLIITDFYRFYIIKASDFERTFYKNPALKNLYDRFSAPNSLFKGNTDEFYSESRRILEANDFNMGYFCFDLERIFSENLSFSSLKPIFKALSMDFLFGEFNPNDANILNEKFYRELLYILGLSEVDEKGREIKDSSKSANKVLIAPSLDSKNGANTLHNAILANLPKESADFESVMQFIVLWLNRILFLKLIEANLVRFNDDKNLKFLNLSKVPNFQVMSHLFFKILAKKHNEREISDSPLGALPYLNSSLFEKHECEEMLDISAIDNNAKLDYFATTQIKDKYGKKKSGSVGLLAYIFEFLDAFDFGSDEGSGEIAMQKELISSSVLGLVFEKLNGYKEGSFFTPSFITSYMCRISLEKVVLQKFGELGLNAVDLDSLKSQILMNTNADFSFRQKALGALQSIRICDPAVGSGHFLVSALCEMIGIYHKLGLIDELSEYKLQILSDEIIIHITDDKIFEYKKPTKPNDNSQSIQKSLFHLKKSIIENNLFGVDINPNSVEICKLRLWIELLKNSYYLRDSSEGFNKNLSESIHQMQTLPNIDINIKCGNSLVSNFALDSTFAKVQTKEFAQNLKATIADYQAQVALYKEALTDKRVIANKIHALKTLLKNYLIHNSDESKRLRENLRQFVVEYGENYFDIESTFGFEMLRIIRSEQKKKVGFKFQPTMEQLEPKEIDKKAVDLLDKIKADFETLESFNSGNALEWRFEFPEVLSENGDFMGFDLIIGNPPYISTLDLSKSDKQNKDIYRKIYPNINGLYDIYILFILLGLRTKSKNGSFAWIVPNKFLIAEYAKQTLDMLLNNKLLSQCVDVSNVNTFKKASVYPIIILGKNNSKFEKFYIESQDDLLALNLKQTNHIDWDRFKTFADFGLKIQSGLAGFQAHSIVKFLTNKKIKNAIPFAVSGSIDRYLLDTQKVTYMKQNYKNPYIIPNNAVSGNKWKFWQNEKIVIAGMTKQLESYYAKTPLAIGVGVYAIYDFAGLNPLLILGVLNSKFMNYIFTNKFKDKHLAGGYLGINKNNLETLPIFKINAKNQKIADKIANLVDKILELKAKDSQSDTTTLESQIDKLVYQLYDLDSHEIQIIESK